MDFRPPLKAPPSQPGHLRRRGDGGLRQSLGCLKVTWPPGSGIWGIAPHLGFVLYPLTGVLVVGLLEALLLLNAARVLRTEAKKGVCVGSIPVTVTVPW